MRRRTFTRLALASAASLSSARAALAQTTADVPPLRGLGDETHVVLDSGAKLFGSLVTPAVAKPPIVLIVPGSGPVDRNGNILGAGLTTDVYAYLAAALASHGIASLRYDKRGVGASSSVVDAEIKVRFDDYIGDAAAWLAELRGDARFAGVSLAGHSEGSLVGMVAAQTQPIEAFVSLEGAGRPLADILRAQIGQVLGGTPSLLAASERILAVLSRGETTNDIPPELVPLFRPSVQPYLVSAFKYDPRQAILRAGRRAAIVQGTADVQVPVEDAKLLAAARPSAKLTIVDRMTNVLKIASNVAPDAQFATVYKDASIPLAMQVPAAIVDAVKG